MEAELINDIDNGSESISDIDNRTGIAKFLTIPIPSHADTFKV